METKQLMVIPAEHSIAAELWLTGSAGPQGNSAGFVAGVERATHAEQLRRCWNAYPELVHLLELAQEQLGTPGTDLSYLQGKINDAVLEHHEWLERLEDLS